MNFKLYQPVWVAFPDSQSPAIGLVVKPGQHSCVVVSPTRTAATAKWTAPVDALAPATDDELAAQPDWVRSALQALVVAFEQSACQEVG